MSLFSERNGYTKPADVLIRECMPEDVCNTLCTLFDELQNIIPGDWNRNGSYDALEMFLWCDFLHNRRNDIFSGMYGTTKAVIVPYIRDPHNEWYKKLDLLELSIKWLNHHVEVRALQQNVLSSFIASINSYFKKLAYSYRIVNFEVVEISSDEEIKAIDEAICCAKDNVREHLNKSLELLSAKPIGDYRNSIKESISAVEAFCRELTGEETLGKALKVLERKGVVIPQVLNNAFVQLYAYTNQPTTGIRHALMDDTGQYVPDRSEATFMLISCSAFLNYLRDRIR